LLCFRSLLLAVGALLLTVSALTKRPKLYFHLPDSPSEVGQLASNGRYVLLICHVGGFYAPLSGSVLRRKRHDPRPAERQRQPRQHRQISVKPDTLDAAHPEEGEAVVVLQASELALD
jgi:hypothetical protein